jgi:hypothetical protein
VREVVLSHDGEVGISETPGGGATGQSVLPLASEIGPSPKQHEVMVDRVDA